MSFRTWSHSVFVLRLLSRAWLSMTHHDTKNANIARNIRNRLISCGHKYWIYDLVRSVKPQIPWQFQVFSARWKSPPYSNLKDIPFKFAESSESSKAFHSRALDVVRQFSGSFRAFFVACRWCSGFALRSCSFAMLLPCFFLPWDPKTNFCEELERLFPTEIGEHLPDGSFGLVKGGIKIRNGSM